MFKDLGWQYIPNIITIEEAKSVIDTNEKILKDCAPEFNSERGNVVMKYAPSSCVFIMKRIQPILENILGENLLPTYWFQTTYFNKSYMVRHKDKETCEISVSMNIESPSVEWPLKFTDLRGKTRNIVTPTGDGVAYMGNDLYHWRSPLNCNESDRYTQLFLHFVRKHGMYSNYAYDNDQECFNLLSQFQ